MVPVILCFFGSCIAIIRAGGVIHFWNYSFRSFCERMIVSLERHPALRAEHVPSFLISFVVFVPVKGQSFPRNSAQPLGLSMFLLFRNRSISSFLWKDNYFPGTTPRLSMFLLFRNCVFRSFLWKDNCYPGTMPSHLGWACSFFFEIVCSVRSRERTIFLPKWHPALRAEHVP